MRRLIERLPRPKVVLLCGGDAQDIGSAAVRADRQLSQLFAFAEAAAALGVVLSADG